MKLIALDIDGTLINSKGVITPKTKKSLLSAQEKGHKLVIITGRAHTGALKYAKELEFDKFDGLVSSFNGGKITNFKTGELIVDHTLDINLAKQILKEIDDLGASYIIYKDEFAISNRKNAHFLDFACGVNSLTKKVVSDLTDSLDFAPNKIIMSMPQSEIDPIAQKLHAKFNGLAELTYSRKFYYEIMPLNVSKGRALLEIANHYGIDRKDIIAFGDQDNDIEMLTEAGVGVAMKNATTRLLEVADFVAGSNDEDGIAKFLEKIEL